MHFCVCMLVRSLSYQSRKRRLVIRKAVRSQYHAINQECADSYFTWVWFLVPEKQERGDLTCLWKEALLLCLGPHMMVGSSHLYVERGEMQRFPSFYHRLTCAGLGQFRQCQIFRVGKRKFLHPAQWLWLLTVVEGTRLWNELLRKSPPPTPHTQLILLDLLPVTGL